MCAKKERKKGKGKGKEKENSNGKFKRKSAIKFHIIIDFIIFAKFTSHLII